MRSFDFNRVGRRMPYQQKEFDAAVLMQRVQTGIAARRRRRKASVAVASLAMAAIMGVLLLLPSRDQQQYRRIMKSPDLEVTLKTMSSDQLESWYCEDVDNL